MTGPTVHSLRLTILSLAVLYFFVGLEWGLPSRAADPFVFGSARTPWTGAQIARLAGTDDEAGERGADVAAHPLVDRAQPIVVNATDTDRARIVRRYRLYSNQPDEMITFRALARMRPGRGDFDPRFFQYGGAWVYPVGAMLKAASLLGLVQLRGDVAFYLDHPEAFGRYYVVARLYSAMWGLVAVLLVFELTRLWTGNPWAAAFAAALVAMMPVVVNAAHEAKPHLAGSAAVLATLWCATRFVASNRKRWAWMAAIAAGVAASMVWTAAAALAVLPAMAWMAPTPRRGRVAFALALAGVSVGVFVLLNPYLPIDLLLHRSVVLSNVGNSAAMYHAHLGVGTIVTAGQLLADAMGPIVLLAAAISLLWILSRVIRSRGAGSHPALLAIGPAALVVGQFVLLATGKPAEYARFSLTLDLLLAIAVAAACAALPSRAVRSIGMIALLVVTAGAGGRYLQHFTHDRSRDSTRLVVARFVASLPGPVVVHAEPAPYRMPPINVFDRRIVLWPAGDDTPHAGGGVDIVATDRTVRAGMLARIETLFGWSPDAPVTWADKSFVVRR